MTRSRRLGTRALIVLAVSTVGLTTYFAGAALADDSEFSDAAKQAHQTPLVPGLACTVTAKACVDLESQKAWLVKDGKIMRGPIKISSGGNGKETPIGHSLRVYRKDKDYKSTESRIQSGPKKGQPAPMPWAVFFEDGGIAFHGGDPARSSAGCIHLPVADAQAFFNYLQIGDQVQVIKGSQELAARKGEYSPSDDEDDGDHNSGDDDSDD